MKLKILVLFISFSYLSCYQKSNAGKEEYEKSDEPKIQDEQKRYLIELDSSHIDNLFSDINELKSIDNLDTVLFELKKIDQLNIDSSQLILRFYNVKGWDGIDPGDFRKLEILRNGRSVSLLNLGGWIKIPQKFRIGSEYFITKNIGLKYPVIILIGYPYASEPPLLTLIGFDDVGPKLLFNKSRSLIHIKEKELLIQDGSGNYSRIYGLEDRIMIDPSPN